MSEHVVEKTHKRRECCGTTYDCHHLDDCPVRGVAARAALRCDITADGWCYAHSTGAGPVRCSPTPPTDEPAEIRAELANAARETETTEESAT